MAEWRLTVNTLNMDDCKESGSEGEEEVIDFPVEIPPPLGIVELKSELEPPRQQNPPKLEKVLRLDADRGAKCTSCENCDGFREHPWRKICSGCLCERDAHQRTAEESIDAHRFAEISLHDNNNYDQKLAGDVSGHVTSNGHANDDYIWTPDGMSKDMIDLYMNSLPSEKIPHLDNPDGVVHRNRQLVYQIPLQDVSFNNCKSLETKDKFMHDAFRSEREKETTTGVVERAITSVLCRGCDVDIDAGSLYVRACALDERAVWHPACFACCACAELLVDLIYCHREGRLFCPRHHAEQYKPRCCMCDELIFCGEYIRTDARAYHSDHFVCCSCERGLSGEQHLVDGGFPICISCYDNKYASACNACGKTIGMDEEDVIYDEAHWHDSCLVCALCQAKLSGSSFVIRDDQFVCSRCYQRTDDKRCKACAKGFEPGAKRLELKGEYWHDTCFTCDVCHAPITTKRFIHHEQQQICCDCYDNNFAKKCGSCQQILREGGVSCSGEHYHRDCFVCEGCSTSIATQAFQQKDSKRYCTPCYKQEFAKKCSGCSDYIITGEFYTLEGDSWHKDCFKCEQCGTVLQQQSFAQEEGRVKLVCERCA